MSFGGGGGGQPTSSTVTQTNIPEYARPYVESMLGATMKELFTTTPKAETVTPAKYDAEGNVVTPESRTPGGLDITGVKPYVPYSEDPTKYFAGFSPLQQQIQSEAAGMQTPGQFGAATGMAGAAGQGALGTTGQAMGFGQAGFGAGQLGQQLGTQGGAYYGGLGAGYGGAAAGMAPEAMGFGRAGMGYGAAGAGMAPAAQMYGRTAADIGQMGLRAEALGRDVGAEARAFGREAAGMGGTYERMATSPAAQQAYMSPYMQNVVDVQKQRAIRDYQEQMPQLQAAATRAGAFGGTRDAVAKAMAQRSLNEQLQNIQATGQQQAFQQAQQAQQFGAGLGLQGLQAAQAGLGTALQGGQLGLGGIGQAIAGQQAGLAGLGQAGQLYGLGMQGAESGLRGLGQAGQLYGLGMQGAGMGLQGVQQQLAGTAQGMQGAGMGLQGVGAAQAGYGLAGQQAANLANIGGQQQAADLARLGFQGQIGGQQQAQQQQIINQAVQNYAMQQEYPRQQLSFMNAMLRGLPMQATTTQSYMAPPSPFSQLAGAGMTAYGLGRMGGFFKEGGKVKEKHYEEGGITSIDQKIINDPTAFSPEIINRGIKSGSISEMAGAIGLSAIKNAQNQAKQQQGLTQGAPEGTILGDLQKQVAGIDTLPSNLPTRYAASGGIIAFAGEDGSLVEDIISRETREIEQGTRTDYSAAAKSAMAQQSAASKQAQANYLQREQQRMLSGNPMMSSYRQPSSAAALATPAAAQAAAYPQEGTRGTASMTRPGGPPGMDLKQVPPAVSAAAVPTASQTSAGPAAPQRLTTDEDGMKQMSVADFKRQQKEFGVSEDPMAEAKAKIASMAGESKLDREFAKNMAFLRAGLGMMGGTSQYALQNIGKGATEGVTQYAQDIKDIKSTERELFKLQTELAKADDARVRGDFKGFQEYNQNARDHMLKLKKLGLDERQVKAYEKATGRPSDEQLRQQMFREDPSAFRRMQEAMRPGFETAQTQRDKAMLEQINNALLTMKKDDPQRKMLEEQRQRIMGRMSGQVETLPPNVQAVIDKYLPKT